MPDTPKAYVFGPHRLMPDRRALFAQGREIAIRSRAFDLLLVLIERRDRVVGKDELMDLVWLGRVVEEGNLTVHVAALRKLLGGGIIATLPGRGYRFVAAVTEETVHAEAPGGAGRHDPEPLIPASVAAALPLRHALPRLLTRLLGRAEDLARLEARLTASRLVTVVGTGGIGKTRLALAAAERLEQRFPDGVWLVDTGQLEDAGLLPSAIASVIGIEVPHGDVLERVTLFLRPRRALLVLDGVEHLLTPVARTTEALLGACLDLAILATSREPLRAAGENLHRLQPLAVPPPGRRLGGAEILAHPACALFVERAHALLLDFNPSEAEVQDIAEICRRLDGIPLAIELAVPVLQALPLSELRKRLDHRFGPLMSGRRAALPRQQTLATTIGWSLDLLKPAEHELLLRLAVFSGGWTVDSASFVAGQGAGEDETCRIIAELVDKSLVEADLAQQQPRYRMLSATRYYAAQRLTPSALAETRAAQARWLATFYARAEADWPFMPDDDWAVRYSPEIENLRATLGWAFGPGGDTALGVAIVSCTEHVWTELSLAPELRHWFDQAIAAITPATPPDVAGRIWLGRCGWLALGDAQALEASQHAVGLFRSAGSGLDLGRALWRHAFQHMSGGQLSEARTLLLEAGTVLRTLHENKALVSWLRASALLCSREGRFDAARDLLAEALPLAHRLRSRRDIALTLGSIAELEFACGRCDAAIAAAQQALDSLGPVQDRFAWVQHVGGALASYLLAAGEVERALAIAKERLEAARVMGLRQEIVANAERIALIAAYRGDTETAGRLLGFGRAHYRARRLVRSFDSQSLEERLAAELQARLTPAILEVLLLEGAEWDDEAAIATCARIA